jgi:hypothetical protein
MVTKCSPQLEILSEWLSRLAIKAMSYCVVAMKQMHQVPTRTLKTSFKITRMTDIFRLPEKMHPLPRRDPHHRFRVVLRRAVVDDLDLHHVRAGILGQHTLQRLA